MHTHTTKTHSMTEGLFVNNIGKCVKWNANRVGWPKYAFGWPNIRSSAWWHLHMGMKRRDTLGWETIIDGDNRILRFDEQISLAPQAWIALGCIYVKSFDAKVCNCSQNRSSRFNERLGEMPEASSQNGVWFGTITAVEMVEWIDSRMRIIFC